MIKGRRQSGQQRMRKHGWLGTSCWVQCDSGWAGDRHRFRHMATDARARYGTPGIITPEALSHREKAPVFSSRRKALQWGKIYFIIHESLYSQITSNYKYGVKYAAPDAHLLSTRISPLDFINRNHRA